jgi:F-type H+-transporting ATPase subunit epsilon
LTGLDIGIILVRQKSSSDWTSLVVTGGFALINSNNVTILVNEAEFGSEINVEQAQISYNSSKHALEMNKDIKRKFELTLNLKKARARFQVTQLKK